MSEIIQDFTKEIKKVNKKSIAKKGLTFVQKIELELVVLTFIIMIGIFVFHKVEGWRYFDSFYFIISTIAAVGLGDFHPITDIGKTVTIFYEIIGMPVFAYTTSLMVQKNFKK